MIRRARFSTTLTADRSTAWALLTDYEQAAAWLPDISGVRVLTAEGDVSVVELQVGGTTVILEAVASPPDGVRFEQVDRSRNRGVSGSWQLSEGPQGGLVLDARIAGPSPLWAPSAGRRLRLALERATAAIEQQLRRPPTARLATYRRALSVVRRGDVIEARIGDTVIEIARIGGDR